MSLFGQPTTKTVELTRGYVDPDGNAHREVTLRAPMIEDEICRDAAIADMRRSGSESERGKADSDALQMLALVKECVMSWDGIADVQLSHLRQLTRRDASILILALDALEAEDAQLAKKTLKEGPEGNDESE